MFYKPRLFIKVMFFIFKMFFKKNYVFNFFMFFDVFV